MSKNIWELCADEFDGNEWFRGLTMKQVFFVREYLKDFNATQAAKRAGYRGNNATLANAGFANMRNPKVLRALRQVVLALGVSPPELAETIQDKQQVALHKYYSEQGLNLLTFEEQDRWHAAMLASLKSKQVRKAPPGPVKPVARGDPFLEDLKRMEREDDW